MMPFKQRLLLAMGGSTTGILCGVFLFLISHYLHFIRIIKYAQYSYDIRWCYCYNRAIFILCKKLMNIYVRMG